MRKLSDYFIGMFPKVLLGNQIVASLVDIVGRKLDYIKDEIDENLNTDL